jgi:hypothetical protein
MAAMHDSCETTLMAQLSRVFAQDVALCGGFPGSTKG